MRGKKGSYYEGGHRVPFFIRWPGGGIADGRDVDEMALHVDLLPTLIELCGLEGPEGVTFDGTSLGPLLRGARQSLPGRRIHTVQIHQGTDPPEMWRNTVMDRRWRLVSGEELYNVHADPGQREDVAEHHPDVVARLREAHQRWWEQVEPGLSDYCPISIGTDEENPTRLDALDVHGDVAWCQVQVVVASRSSGRWAVKVEQPGTYRFRLRRWPDELDLPIDEPAPQEEADRVAPYFQVWQRGTIEPVEAILGIFGRQVSRPVRKGDHETSFEIELDRTGETMLDAWFIEREGERRGAYYVYVERL
jgi:arylsulfatase B